MDINLFDYDLPEELIAQTPLEKRDHSRLMIVDKNTGAIEDTHFYDIVKMFHKGDVLVRNNTRVIPARLFGLKEETGGHCEVLLLKNIEDNVWECLCGNARIIKVGTVITLSDELQARCIEVRDEGIRILEMLYDGIFYEILDRAGNMPLPPYIKEKLEDKERYQTIYAAIEGSAAAPTAGLHFTEDVLHQLKEKGVIILDVTLHVGLGTFRPVKVDNILEHHMHSEYYEIDEETARELNKAKAEGRRIISVGTTSTRTLEANMKKYHSFTATKENTDIFIYPGYTFEAIDGLITNFHLPKSTLLMLVSAFSSREIILNAYKHAVSENYRFFSFGDAMLLI